MELKEIETEVQEQDQDAADIALEVESHKQHMESLEEAVHALLEAQRSVNSEGVRRAIDHAAEARHTTEERLRELRAQKEAMLDRNGELQERCTTALGKKREVLEKLPHLLWGQASAVTPGDPNFSIYSSMQQLVTEGIERLSSALSDLTNIEGRLERLEI